MSKLNRIIAIDNISRNQIMEIHADGHTNFAGENGAGKTTTLRASLLFFGSRPGDIAKSKGDTFIGFGPFYFPRITSYLVYEYERAGEILCVICSSSNGQIQYQFLNTAFNEDFFLYEKDNKKMIAQNAQLRLNIEQHHFELSKKVSPDVYSEIIQSNKPYRKRTPSADIIRELRPRYSLPTQGKSMIGVDRVLANIFSSKASVAHIQSALTNILIQDNMIPSRTLSLDEQSGSINEWFHARGGWLALDAQRESIILLSDSASKYISINNNLSSLYSQCKILLAEHEEKCKQLQHDISKATTDENDARVNLGKERDANSQKLNDLQSNLELLTRRTNDLLKIKNDFEVGSSNTSPIADLKVMSGKLETLQVLEANSHTLYNDVSKGIQDIISFYSTQQAQIKTVISQLEKNTQVEIGKSQDHKHEELERNTELFKQKAQSLLTIRDQRRKTLQANILSFEQQSAGIKARLQDFGFNAQYRDNITSYESEIKVADKDFQEAVNENRDIGKLISKTKDERTLVVEAITTLRIDRQSDIDEQNTIRKRLENGTLFDYLQSSVPEFELSIGKVINPELLATKGLNPSFDKASDSLYGLKINLDSLGAPSLLNKNELHTRIIELDEIIAGMDIKITEAETSLGKLNDQVRKSEGKFARSELEVKEVQRYLSEQREALDQEKNKALVEVKGRHEKEKESLSECNAKLGKLNVDDRKIITQYDTDVSTLSEQEKANVNSIKTQHNNNVKKLNSDLKISVDEQLQATKTLDEKKNQDIKEKGLSPDRIEEARVAYEQAKENVRRSIRAGERVCRYDSFMSKEWLGYQQVTLQIENETLAKKQFELTSQHDLAKLQAKYDYFTREITNLKKALPITSSGITIASDLIEKLKANSIESDPSGSGLFMALDINTCLIKYNNLKADFDTYKTRGQNEFNNLEGVFCKTTGTPTRKFYERMKSELSINNTSNSIWVEAAPILAGYIENEHLSQADLLRSNYILVALKIADFSELLSSTHKALNNLGRKLTSTTRSVVERFDAIGNIEIKVSSKVKELSYFPALEAFSSAHENWAVHNSDQLPDDKLIGKLTNLINMIGSNKLQVDVDKSFLFEVELEKDGEYKRARTDSEIEGLSSTGLSYLIIVAIYIGLINLLRTDPDVSLHFCVDEIGKLSNINTSKLIKLFEEHNIIIFSALPDSTPELLQHYPYAYFIKETGSHSRLYQLYGEESRITTQSKIASLINKAKKGTE